jgi:hypothetical protein
MKETISIIINIIKELKNAERMNGGELSSKALMLSVYKVYLGQEIVSLEYALNHNKVMRKNLWGQAFVEAVGTVDVKKITADKAVEDLVKEEIETERKIGVLKNLRVDCSDVVSTMQTRMSQLRNELAESKNN